MELIVLETRRMAPKFYTSAEQEGVPSPKLALISEGQGITKV